FFTLYNQPMYLDVYNNGGTPAHTVPNNSQFKCYDGMHSWNELQPAPYDGMYQFPSIVNRDPTSGAAANVPGSTTNPAGTGTPGLMAGSNCTICVANPTDGTPMLPNGQYVVEMLVPPGYELVKEEDKNILIGDNYIAPGYVSLCAQWTEVAPCAGAKRNLCDRKLIQLDDQSSVLAKFWVFTSAHVAAHFTGVITDDFTSEFDPFSPQFGEKFSPANLP